MFQFDTLGQEIVEELSRLIQEQVVLTDQRGIILASTDSTRINQFHEGALLCLRQEQMLPMTDKEVDNLPGVRKGVVLPISIDGEPIAVLGITGEPDHIKPQALLILRVVELFIQDSLKRREKEDKVRELEFFVFDWLTTIPKDKRFMERAARLGIEVELYKQVAMIESMTNGSQFSIENVEYLMSIQNVHKLAKMIRWGQGKILLLVPEINQQVLKMELENILLHAKRRLGTNLAVGIGGPMHYDDMIKSFNQAERATEVSKKLERIVFEHELRFDLILHSVPISTKEEFIRRTVAPIREDKVLIHNLRVWFNENQSMQNTAEILHIHKNTLTYRLQKVEKLTGLSVYNIQDVLLIYLGLRFIDESNNE